MEIVERLRNAVQVGCFAADAEVIGFRGTEADRTRLAISAAIDHLEQIGLIQLMEPDEDAWIPLDREIKRV